MWHIRGHITYGLKRIADISYMMADFYKFLHKRTTQDYKNISERLYSAMRETSKLQTGKTAYQQPITP